ncbi:hypothetical protein B0H10DRAFT_2117911 [Mycena sp. CBHHK59/15]|nr:hypothetical protein B0H10DRAFT_2117911 [Mycena sp. CBHHK59/15]
MKLCIPFLVAGAGLLASASPMRVVIVSSNVEHPEHPTFRPVGVATIQAAPAHAPCGRLRQKASGLAAAFRLALGLDTKPHAQDATHAIGTVTESVPLPFVGTPLGFVEGTTPGGDRVRIVAHHRPRPHRVHRAHSFLMRVHFALMSLGAWEGRAVAFVLGCGIGVLLRMFWVIAVLSFRLLTGARRPEHEYALAPADADAEELVVAPPQYVLDEKVAEAL